MIVVVVINPLLQKQRSYNSLILHNDWSGLQPFTRCQHSFQKQPLAGGNLVDYVQCFLQQP